MTPFSASAALSFICLLVLLLPAQHGAVSTYANYKIGSRQVFFKTLGKSSSTSQQASTTATCSSSTTTGQDNSKLPVVHRQNPCSPLHGLPSLTAVDVQRRDASLVQRRFSLQSSLVAAPAPSPSSAGIIIPVIASGDPVLAPGALEYTVLISYGTPQQQLSVILGNSFGTSVLRCKPCAPGSKHCDPAFDTERSSTFAHVLCGSPDCPTNCSGGSVCPYSNPYSYIQGTFAKDVLTLAPSMAVDEFRFVCQDVGLALGEFTKVGTLDLSRDRNSLPSRLSSSFSYCLPPPSSSEGFLHLGGDVTAREEDNLTVHAPLVPSKYPELGSMYFVDIVGMSLGDEMDLPIPAAIFGGNASAKLDVGATFTLLAPAAYTAVRDSFRRQMSQYDHLTLPVFDGFDTCYNFTGLHEYTIQLVGFKFSNGQSLVIDNGMLYYHDPNVGPFTVSCLAFSALNNTAADVYSAVIGAYTLVSTEVLYDVAGGKVGFIPFSC